MTYQYDSQGNKLQKTSNATGAAVTTRYVGGIQYTGSNIDFIQTEEGVARRNGANYSYEYNLTDHLGNVRVTFNRNPTTGAIAILQKDDYFAFGKRSVVQGGSNKYLYNGKELQEELEMYDYEARFYDPVIGRWNVVDPLAEQGRRWSPYSYAFNNPVRYIDPDGMWPWPSNPFSQAQSLFNNTVTKVQSSYANAEAGVKSAYNQTAKTVSNTGTVIKNWTVQNKQSLLTTAKNLQDGGDKVAAAGAVAAIAGAPIAGVGAAPGATLATAGKAVSLTGVVLDVAVEFIAGSDKSAGVTIANEAAYGALGKLGSKAIDNIIPGPTPDVSNQLNEGMKQAAGLLEAGVKKQTDKVVFKIKDKQ